VLADALQNPSLAADEENLLFRLARGTGLSGEALAERRPVLAFSQPEAGSSGLPAREAARDVVLGEDGKKGYQGELFGAELVLQPL
jgi:hypothetical protein